jgi:hypothetical protein
MCLGGGTPSVPVMQPVEEPTPVIIQQAAPPVQTVDVPEPTPPPSPSKDVTENASRIRSEQAKRLSEKRGIKGTLLTGGSGLVEPATTAKKTLLSGTR